MLDSFCITPGRYACTGCAFDQPWPFPPKRPVYRLDDGTMAYGFAARGWCGACRCVRQIESFDLEFARKSADRNRRWANERQEEAARIRGGWFPWSRKSLERRRLKFDAQEHLDEADKLAAHAKVLENRKSKPRCLECGSEDTRAFAFDQESGIDTNFEHACGGHLKIVGPDADTPRFYVSIHEVLLTPEGELLERDDDD